MNESNNSSSLMVGGIAAVVGLVIGFAGASMFKTDVDDNMMTDTDGEVIVMTDGEANTETAAADLRVVLNALERQHVNLASAAVRNGFDGDPDFAASAAALDVNSVELSKAVGSVYGAAAEKRFLEIWRSHIGFFVDYTVAAKGGDEAGMDKAVTNLTEVYVPSIAAFFSEANPNLPEDVVAQLVTEHVLALKATADAYVAGDYTKSYTEQTKTDTQIGKIADALAGAIVKQYPDKF